jgi:hypothetical protein
MVNKYLPLPSNIAASGLSFFNKKNSSKKFPLKNFLQKFPSKFFFAVSEVEVFGVAHFLLDIPFLCIFMCTALPKLQY